MATGEYREEQPNGYYFDEPCDVRQIVAVPSGGFAVTFMKAFKFNRLQFYGRDSVGGKLASTLPESPCKSRDDDKFAKPATQMIEMPGRSIWARALSHIHILLVFGFSLVSSAQQLCTLRVNINDVFFGDCAQVSGRFGCVVLNESRD